MKGSIFTTLSVVNLKATPTEPGPIQRLEVGTLNLRYSLWGLIRIGLPAFLKELDVRNVYVELTPGEPLPPEKEAEPQALKFPAIFPELLNIENVNVLVQAPTGNTVLEGLFFSLLPDRPGILQVQTLDIPGVRRWTDIKAATTFRDRNLLLTGLFIGKEIALEKFQLNMSDLEKNELGVALNGTFFDAPVTLDAHISDLNATSHTTMKADVRGLVFDPVWQYLNISPPPAQGELEGLSAAFAGEPLKPSSWTGDVTARLKDLAAGGQSLGRVELVTTMKEGRAQVSLHDDLDDKNSVTLTAKAELPDKMDGFATTKAQGRLEVLAPETGKLKLPEPVAGDLAVKADFQLNDGLLSAKATIDSATLAAAGAELTETHFTIGVEKDLTQPAEAPIFRTLVTSLEGGIAKLRFQDYTADDLKLKLASRDAQVSLQEFALTKETNTVRTSADYVLPDDLKSWDRQPLKIDLAVDAPNLAAFLAPDAGVTLKGAFKLAGKAEMRDRVVNGDFLVEGAGIEANGLPVRTLNARVGVADNRVNLSALDIVMDDKNRVQGNGEIQLGEALSYWGSLNVELADLSLFQPFLGTAPDAPQLGGKLTLYWKGSGDVKTPQHYGSASLDLTGGRFADQKNLTAHFNASYAPDHINIPDLAATSDLANAALSLFWKGNRLSITNLTVTQKKLTLIEGSAELPLHLTGSKPDDFIPPHDPLSVKLKTRDLDLPTLFLQLGQKKSPLLGKVSLDVDAQGTTDDLVAKIALRATGIQSTEAEQFAPAEISIDVTAKDDRIGLDGTVKQKLIEPLRITGNLPFDGATAVRSGNLDPATPVQAQVSLPRSSLAFVASLVPAIRQSRGTAAIDVRLNGTVGNPQFDGTVNADLDALRFTDPSLPPVSAVGLRVNFTHNQLRIERCAGRIGGGTFSAGGGVTFSTLDNPTFDLRLGARNALVLQNDDMTARISSDIRVTGPLRAGTVAGTVWVTRSRFFKNVDILPIGLPGRPAPQPPEEPTVISFPQPPLRDWKFDIAIKTADPFLVQSNLANGRIFIDLHLGGTGLEPWMDGTVNIERLVASLPFSRLTIQSGQVFFTRQRPFIPQLNLRGTSTVRDYNVSVFITGPVTEPEAFFSSEPPLPQADVVSLLATGMTTTELGRDPNALAGRAAILVFQKLYNSVFRRNRPPPENDSFLSRIQFDIGTTDAKTGRQSTSLGIPLSDRIMLVGGLDVGGNFRGQLKYLIRFK